MIDKEFQVRYSYLAVRDLDDIFQYLANDLGMRQTAERLIAKIRREINSLTYLPFRYPLLGVEPLRKKGLRKIAIGGYLILYRIESEVVNVVRVVHETRDLVRVL